MLKFLSTVCLILTTVCLLVSSASGQNRKLSFNRDVRPILSDKCFQCHGPDEMSREADLRFDRKESAMSAIEPGDPESSELILRILDEDPDVQMPPPHAHKPLKPEEVEILKSWVKQGANWTQFWAYVPPNKTPVPQVNDAAWSRNWIDSFVLKRLQANQMSPSREADKVTLIRRIYFDLIGLPPTPDQVQSFVNNPSPDAYQTIVDELIESQHFGERMAVYWLDLVRYADTVGYHGDQPHNIAPYRNWVINAFNENQPFDEFTREQLAGDLLADPTEQQQIASGYNRLLQTTHEGGLQEKEYRSIYAADRVRNMSAVWMGATVGCAQCHDHKYDPYTAKDFYAMAAFFADIDDEQHFKNGTNALPTRRSPEILIISDENRTELDTAKKTLALATSAVNELKKEKAKLDSQLKKAKDDAKKTIKTSLAEWVKKNRSASKKLNQQRKLVAEIESRGQWTMITKPLKQPRTTRLLPRGNWLDETGPIVEPAIPEFMGKLEPKTKRASRLDLANWLVDNQSDSGLLTARVFVNRVWYLMMGVGVSRSLDDFGGQGVAPAYPELLDNLAVDFANDWDVKRLIKQIVNSKTYRQSSVTTEQARDNDPLNQFFGRQSRYRLPAEFLRDNALTISGLLNVENVGGKSSKPYQPTGYFRHLNFPPRRYAASTDSKQWRRGVYVHWQRMFLHPTLKALDAPTREESTCERSRSNTPLAALAMLNDPSFVEAARVFAQRIINEPKEKSFKARLTFAYQWSVSRNPDAAEIAVLKDVFHNSLEEFKAAPESAKKLINIGQFKVDENIDVIELAAWTNVARSILNMSETISRN